MSSGEDDDAIDEVSGEAANTIVDHVVAKISGYTPAQVVGGLALVAGIMARAAGVSLNHTLKLVRIGYQEAGDDSGPN